MIKEIKKLIEK